MKRNIKYCIVFFILFSPLLGNAQYNYYWREPTKAEADSLEHILPSIANDSTKMYLNRQLGLYYQEINRSLSLSYYDGQLRLAQELRQPLWEAEAMSRIGHVSSLQQNYSGSLSWLIKAEKIASDPNTEKQVWNAGLFTLEGDKHRGRLTVLASIYQHIGLLYYFVSNKTTANDGKDALRYYRKTLKLSEYLKDKALQSLVYSNMGAVYRDSNRPDSGKWALQKGLQYCRESGHTRYKAIIHYELGGIFESESDFDRAKNEYDSCVWSGIETESQDFIGLGYLGLAEVSLKTGKIDSALLFARKGYAVYSSMKDTLGLTSSAQYLYRIFDAQKQTDSAFCYLKKANELALSTKLLEQSKKFQMIGFDEQIRIQTLEAERLRTQSRIRVVSLAAGAGVLLLISTILYRSNKRQKSDKDKIEKAYGALKSTQAQLIHSEKMASLGELTAGIAHEIQNPLNFVNNFSEVSSELIREMKSELATGNLQPATDLADDIERNLDKIVHHGKRADGIVKGMLQHSRSSSGEREPTDINELCDEYIRLAYHGYRAKDKSFNVNFETDFDPTLPKINVVPQDIGRVVLNLINNAFYACAERMTSNQKQATSNQYSPLVTVSTKNLGDNVEIRIKDNGNGIPDSIKEKIFQPFFTTKPTGLGTGLGLSLSYDIMRVNGGEIKVETREGGGTVFNIVLPSG